MTLFLREALESLSCSLPSYLCSQSALPFHRPAVPPPSTHDLFQARSAALTRSSYAKDARCSLYALLCTHTRADTHGNAIGRSNVKRAPDSGERSIRHQFRLGWLRCCFHLARTHGCHVVLAIVVVVVVVACPLAGWRKRCSPVRSEPCWWSVPVVARRRHFVDSFPISTASACAHSLSHSVRTSSHTVSLGFCIRIFCPAVRGSRA